MIASPFVKLSKATEKKWRIILLVFVLIFMVLMRYLDAPLKNASCTNGIISFELAKHIETSKAILNSWDEQAKKSVYLSLGFDFIFLIIYATFIGFLLHKLTMYFQENSIFSNLGKLLIWLVFLAAFLDSIENIALLQLLSGNLNQVWSTIAYYFALTKFAILLICLVYLILGWITVGIKRFVH